MFTVGLLYEYTFMFVHEHSYYISRIFYVYSGSITNIHTISRVIWTIGFVRPVVNPMLRFPYCLHLTALRFCICYGLYLSTPTSVGRHVQNMGKAHKNYNTTNKPRSLPRITNVENWKLILKLLSVKFTVFLFIPFLLFPLDSAWWTVTTGVKEKLQASWPL